MKRFALPLIILLLLVALLAAGLTRNPRVVPSPLVGKPAPEFTLTVLGDSSRQFRPSDMRGKPWIMNVWASWCVSCREEHPVLMQIADSGRISIIGLNYKDSTSSARQWLYREGDPYKISVVDPDGMVGIDYGVYGVPETYLVDASGIVRYKSVGPLTTAEWSGKLLPMLESMRP